MSSNVLGSFIDTVTGLLSPHGPATQAATSYAPAGLSVHFFLQLAVMAGPLFELVYGRNARESGELDTLEGALAADAA